MSAPCDRFEREHLAELLALDALDPEARAHLDRCADCGPRLAEYERIARAMREIGAAHQRRPDHLARLWARIDERKRIAGWGPRGLRPWGGAEPRGIDAPPARRPGRWPWLAAPALGLAAAVALIWWLRGGEPAPGEPAPRFAVEVVSQHAVAVRGDARLGDRLRVRARAGAAVWIYRNDRELLLACPRDCARDGDALIGEVALDAIARYQIVWLSTASAPAPGGELERDVAAASAAGATHELREIVVE